MNPSKGMWKNLRKFTDNLHELTFSNNDYFSGIKVAVLNLIKCCCKNGKEKKYLGRTEKIF